MTEQELRERLVVSMRAKDKVATTIIRGVLAALKNKAIENKGVETTEADVNAVIKREVKQGREALEFAQKGGRTEAEAEESAKIAFLEELLPAQMDTADLEAAIDAILNETGAEQIGQVMKELGTRHAGLYDGKTASGLVARKLKGG